MSCCTFSDGDVYLVASSVVGGWTCYQCRLNLLKKYTDGFVCTNTKLLTVGATSKHLQIHIDAGHEVPHRVIAEIALEIKKHGEDWTGKSPYAVLTNL